jgi:hypothetical protein
MTVTGVALDQGVTRQAVRVWIVQGVGGVRLRAYRLGGGRLLAVRRRDLNKFLERIGRRPAA